MTFPRLTTHVDTPVDPETQRRRDAFAAKLAERRGEIKLGNDAAPPKPSDDMRVHFGNNGHTFFVWSRGVPEWAYRMCDGERFRLACFDGFENAVEVLA